MATRRWASEGSQCIYASCRLFCVGGWPGIFQCAAGSMLQLRLWNGELTLWQPDGTTKHKTPCCVGCLRKLWWDRHKLIQHVVTGARMVGKSLCGWMPAPWPPGWLLNMTEPSLKTQVGYPRCTQISTSSWQSLTQCWGALIWRCTGRRVWFTCGQTRPACTGGFMTPCPRKQGCRLRRRRRC